MITSRERVELQIPQLGHEKVTIEHVSSEKMMDTMDRSFHYKHVVRIHYKGKNKEMTHEDFSRKYKKSIFQLSADRLAESFQFMLLDASMYWLNTFDEFCLKSSIFDTESCKEYYEQYKNEFEKLHDLLGIDGAEMEEIAIDLLERFNYFPVITGDVTWNIK